MPEPAPESATPSMSGLALLGVIAGTLSSALGVGAGLVLVPALTLGMGVDQKVAQGTALAVMVPMAATGWLRYHLDPAISLDTRMILVLVPFVILGANLGSSVAAAVPAHVLGRVFGLFAVLVGLKMIWQT